MDLDKAWHGLHFLFTGEAWGGAGPLAFINKGGAKIGDFDVGYGPARAFRSAQARAIADALDALPDGFVRARYDPDHMARLDIYPSIWSAADQQDENIDYLEEYFGLLKGFLADARKDGVGFVAALT